MARRRGNGLFEAMQLMTAQQVALSNPQAPKDLKPIEKVLTAEERQRAARQANMNGWQALHERYQREAGNRKTF